MTNPTAALLLFVAGVGLGWVVGFAISWHRWSRALQRQRAAHQQLCGDMALMTRDIRARIDRAEALVFHVPLNPAKRGQPRTGE